MSDPALEESLPKPGQLLAGKYRVERLIAAGGMGAVLKAHHEVLDQAVAVKVMRPEIAGNADAAARFLREARAAAKIASDYVARVTDTGTLEDRTPFMVMELLEGEDLDARLDAEPRLPVATAVDIAVQALAGLEAAHALGIVHRDLKPSNLFLVKRAGGSVRVKLLDFGISKVVHETELSLKAGATTSAGAMLGTPRYMSPEQVSSAKSVDHRTDLWAMGLILYEALTGTYPFHGENPGEVLAAILTQPVPRLSSLRPDVPLELERAVHQAIARRREERFSSARDMIVALRRFASPRVQSLLLELEDAAPFAKTSPYIEVPTERTGQTPRRATPDGGAAGAPAAARTAATRIEPAPSPDAPEGGDLPSDLGPRAARVPTATESGVTLGGGARRGGRWAVTAAAVAGVAAVAGIGWLFLARDTPERGAASATARSPASADERARAGQQEAPTQTWTSLVVAPSSAAPTTTPSASAPAASAAPPAGSTARPAAAPPGGQATPRTTAQPKGTGGILTSRD